jgi:hypothetical protein
MIESRRDFKRTGGVNMTLYEFPISLKDWWCGWRLLPPGFQFPVKELVASLNSKVEGYIAPLFL